MTTTIVTINKSIRDDAIKKFKDFFTEKYSVAIEQGLYDYSVQFCECMDNYFVILESVYNDKYKDLLFNIESNNETIQEIIVNTEKGEFNIYNLAFMEPSELDKENWKKIISRSNTSEEKLRNLPCIKWRPCKLCKHVEHFYYQLQTRSADEPITTFYICKYCNKTSRINN